MSLSASVSPVCFVYLLGNFQCILCLVVQSFDRWRLWWRSAAHRERRGISQVSSSSLCVLWANHARPQDVFQGWAHWGGGLGPPLPQRGPKRKPRLGSAESPQKLTTCFENNAKQLNTSSTETFDNIYQLLRTKTLYNVSRSGWGQVASCLCLRARATMMQIK